MVQHQVLKKAKNPATAKLNKDLLPFIGLEKFDIKIRYLHTPWLAKPVKLWKVLDSNNF